MLGQPGFLQKVRGRDLFNRTFFNPIKEHLKFCVRYPGIPEAVGVFEIESQRAQHQKISFFVGVRTTVSAENIVDFKLRHCIADDVANGLQTALVNIVIGNHKKSREKSIIKTNAYSNPD